MRYFSKEIASICGARFTGTDRPVSETITDSRGCSFGEEAMFVAIRGARHDGHAYVNSLYERGVRTFLVETAPDTAACPEAGFIVADDTVAALQRLAAHHRSRFRGIVAAVTGSNGKTMVKEWIAQLAPAECKVFRSPRSYNSQIGVPLSVLMMEGDETLAVIEAGISQPGEMSRLQRIIRPDIGIFTNLGDAHRENFASAQALLDEKLNLFEGCGRILLNSDCPQAARRCRERFPDTPQTDAAALRDVYDRFTDPASARNASLAVALWDTMGAAHEATVARLADLKPVAMRLEVKEGIGDSLLVNDSYNLDINSLAIALDYLRNIAGRRPLTLILSDILQSGFSDEELYGQVAQMVANAGVETVIGIGDRIRSHLPLFGCRTECYPSADAFLRAVTRSTTAGRAILVKGNRHAQFERLCHALELRSHTTVLEVNLDAMIHNLNLHRSLLTPGTRLMAMVKASGYGSGTYEVANILQSQGVDYLDVAFADEGVTLRQKGITMPIVVLNADEGSFDIMITNRLEPEIYNFNSLQSFTDAVRRHGEHLYPIHLKIDSGMHRLGFEERDTEALCRYLNDHRDALRVSSVFSHLCVADEPAQDDFTRSQIALFRRMSDAVTARIGYRPLRHIANSAGIIRFPEAHFDMCRLGVGLYGFGTPGLRPVSTLRTRIVQIKELAPDQTVGYGRAGVLTRPTRTATIPVGYADGLDRHLGCGRWSMLVAGRPAPIVGRICMDSCMIDITDIEGVREGDPVLVFSDRAGNTAEDMAAVLGTICYEVLTSVSTRVKRIYTKE